MRASIDDGPCATPIERRERCVPSGSDFLRGLVLLMGPASRPRLLVGNALGALSEHPASTAGAVAQAKATTIVAVDPYGP